MKEIGREQQMKWSTADGTTKSKKEQTDLSSECEQYPSNTGYTQREWDRVVGWGLVPDEYKR